MQKCKIAAAAATAAITTTIADTITTGWRVANRLKFHKVAGTFLNQALWHNIQRGQLAGTWREVKCERSFTSAIACVLNPTSYHWQDVCGEFTVHYGTIYEHNSLGLCSLTPTFKVITLLRRPINKILSALYWYAPESALASKPWTTFCGNWTRADTAKMIQMYETDFQAPGMKVSDALTAQTTRVRSSALAHLPHSPPCDP